MWHLVENKTPDTDREVLVWVNNLENPEWSRNKLGAYINSKWYCRNGRENHEIVERWAEIPEYNG